jgi:hypothetical protein
VQRAQYISLPYINMENPAAFVSFILNVWLATITEGSRSNCRILALPSRLKFSFHSPRSQFFILGVRFVYALLFYFFAFFASRGILFCDCRVARIWKQAFPLKSAVAEQAPDADHTMNFSCRKDLCVSIAIPKNLLLLK